MAARDQQAAKRRKPDQGSQAMSHHNIHPQSKTDKEAMGPLNQKLNGSSDTLLNVTQAYEHTHWLVSILKQSWPQILVAISLIFSAGVFYEQTKVSGEKIQALGTNQGEMSKAIATITSDLSYIRGKLDAQHSPQTPPTPRYVPRKTPCNPDLFTRCR
jgi:hypothetical protein